MQQAPGARQDLTNAPLFSESNFADYLRQVDQGKGVGEKVFGFVELFLGAVEVWSGAPTSLGLVSEDLDDAFVDSLLFALDDFDHEQQEVVSGSEAHLAVDDDFEELDVHVGGVDVLERLDAGLPEVVDVRGRLVGHFGPHFFALLDLFDVVGELSDGDPG